MARRSRAHTHPPSPESPRRRRLKWLLVIAGVSAIAAVVLWMRPANGMAPRLPQPQPNVLMITLDTTRADRIGSYGYRGAATPHLDRLAAGGVRFEHAFSPAPLTLPAHASLMTGRQPYAHGVRNNGYFTLTADVPTLAEAFAAAGYETAAFVSAFVLDRQFGIAQGFSHYDDALDRTAAGDSSLDLARRGDRTVAAASQWLSSRGSNRPFFLWVHLFDPHEPYDPPAPFSEQFADRPYDGEIAFTDALIGSLLERSGYDRSSLLVVVSGDHGESLGDHGESTHGLFVYDAALRVPLIVAGAGVTRTGVVADPVRLIDVAPTLTDFAGIPALPGVDGRSLRPLADGGERAGEAPPIYAETYFPQFFMGWSPLRSLRVGRWKFIDAPEPELYDLSTDSGERHNVIAQEPARAESLRRALTSTLLAHAHTPQPAPMSDEARQRLASLGYVSMAHAPAGGSEARGPDPKHMVALFERLLDGNRALASGDPARALGVAEAVLEKDPTNAFARFLQGRAALALDRHQDALAAFTAYLSLVPQSADGHHLAALAALRLGDRQRALAEEEAALALDPRHTNAVVLRAGLLFSMGRREAGLSALRDAARREPTNHRLALELADLLADAQQFDDAEGEYRRVLNDDPANARALAGLGMALFVAGQPEAALEPLTRALAINAADEEARLARAGIFTELGRVDEARAEFELLRRTAVRPDIRAAARAAIREATPAKR